MFTPPRIHADTLHSHTTCAHHRIHMPTRYMPALILNKYRWRACRHMHTQVRARMSIHLKAWAYLQRENTHAHTHVHIHAHAYTSAKGAYARTRTCTHTMHAPTRTMHMPARHVHAMCTTGAHHCMHTHCICTTCTYTPAHILCVRTMRMQSHGYARAYTYLLHTPYTVHHMHAHTSVCPHSSARPYT